MILAMWSVDKTLAIPEGRRSAQLFLGFLLALPFLTRSIGIVVAPVGLGAPGGVSRPGLPAGWLWEAATIMLPWMFWMLIGPYWHASVATAHYPDYLRWWSSFGMPSLGRVAFLNVLYTLLSSGAIGLGMFSA